MEESKQADFNLFVTLTYNNENIPRSSNGYQTLKRKDLQDYFKRVRKRPHFKFKYYAVGEYGSKTQRPHYHILMFVKDLGTRDIKQGLSNREQFQNILTTCWSNKTTKEAIGNIHIGKITEASTQYTLKYIDKPKKIKKHERDDRETERALMSKNLGISYINKETIKWHKDKLTERYYLPVIGGHKVPMPRYYRDKIYKEKELEYIKDYWLEEHENKQKEFDKLLYKEKIVILRNNEQKQLAVWRKQNKQNNKDLL